MSDETGLSPRAAFRRAAVRPALRLAVYGLFVAAFAGLLAAGVAAPVRSAEESGVRYDLAIEGLADFPDLRSGIEDVSQLKALRDRPPSTVSGLRRRADDDVETIVSFLRSKGYYGAAVDAKLETAVSPARVTLDVRPGKVYRIADIAIENAEGSGPKHPLGVSFDALGIETGMPGEAQAIAGAKPKLLRSVEDKSYAFARVVKQRVVVDHDKASMFVYLTVDTGPSVGFGETTITGNDSVDEAFVRRRIAWNPGEPYSRSAVDATRERLSETGLFSGITITHAEKPGPDGRVAMTIALVEQKKQTIGGGVQYSTSDGPGVKAFWRHRNLFGAGERLSVTGEGSFARKFGSVEYAKPDFFSIRNTGILSFRVAEESPDGFDSTEIEASGRIERDFSKLYKGSLGVAVEQSIVEDAGDEETFTLLSLPGTLRRDTSNDLLNPTSGGRTTLSLTPYVEVAGDGASFTVVRLRDATYFPLDDARRHSLAVWGSIASIFGETTDGVPANKRIYSGGPGSVRAFALNRLGPLDSAGDPVGGRSSLEAGIEARIRVYGDFAVVPFVEAGSVHDDAVPRFGKDIRWGGGLGLRYHTSIGPIRLDVAVPFNGRKEDDAFQLLISLGQAF